ncbi:sugar kinase [Halalkalibacter akibai]|uniref:2-dehydro-3-deoxygluconate kinase n=1 Tax=Halalkalibacter akibai (strain ATCC 43226 / DSM 21942 / CIP 109018 / JCM 9157 / 1139) TaxID=1236973 RepID=W4QNP7_HALA3|nr:sugar kinase [Halalkalibacter akibai]GAE33740.1 2-dehydro-3-deoxygluconate kinase [Halalkalibacter akibai JCM 9157]
MDVVTIGETMVLFTPETGQLRYASQFSKTYGGAESNFAIGLARLGHQVGWISAIGDDELGKGMLSFIRGEGVDVSQVKVDETAPTGVFFKEVRNSSDIRIQYYRKGSAASQMTKADLNEDYLAQAKYLHISGITPALSENCSELIFEAIALAKKNGLTVIFDPNLRRKLWSEEKAREVLLKIASQVDIVLPGVAEGEFLFGESDPETLGKLFLEHGASTVILKVGAEGAYYFTNEESALVPGFKVEQVLDPVGAGDGFAAGFISGRLEGLSLYESVQRGNAVGAIVTTVKGDVEGLPEKREIDRFITKPADDVSR